MGTLLVHVIGHVCVALMTCAVICQAEEVCLAIGHQERILTVETKYGCGIIECYNMTGNETEYEDYNYEGWILPDFKVINQTYNDGRIQAKEDVASWSLTIHNITRVDIGYYHCMLTKKYDNRPFLYRLGLNIRGPYFVRKWDTYRMNTIIGCSAFGGFLLVVIGLSLLHRYRWRAPKPEDPGYDAYVTKHAIKDEVYKAEAPAFKEVTPDLRRRLPASNVTDAAESRTASHDDVTVRPASGRDNKAFVNDGDTNKYGKITDDIIGSFFDDIDPTESQAANVATTQL